MDKCLDYEKIIKAERKGKGVNKSQYEPTYSATKTYTPDELGKDLTRSGRRSIKAGSQSDLSTNSIDFGRSKRGLDESFELDTKQIKKKKEEYIVKKIFSDDNSNHHAELLAAFPFDELIESLKNKSKSNGQNENTDKVEMMVVENVTDSAEEYLNSLSTAASLVSPEKETVKVLMDNDEVTEIVDAIIVDNEKIIKVPSENKLNLMNLENTDDNNDIIDNDDANDKDDRTIKFYTILRELQKDAQSTPFWEGVNTKLYPDYRRYVKDPMDLGTIAERVINGYYQSNHEAFAMDIKKVWYACRKYNDADSDLVLLASKYEKLLEQLYETHFNSEDPSSNVEF
jgi:hypothetical protein